MTKSDNIRQNLTAVEFRWVHIYGILPEGVAGQQRSSPGLELGFVRLIRCTCGGCSSYICTMMRTSALRTLYLVYVFYMRQVECGYGRVEFL